MAILHVLRCILHGATSSGSQAVLHFKLSSVVPFREINTYGDGVLLVFLMRRIDGRERSFSAKSQGYSTPYSIVLSGQNPDPLASIMERYAGAGPYSLLYRLHDEGRRASVMIRRLNRCGLQLQAIPRGIRNGWRGRR